MTGPTLRSLLEQALHDVQIDGLSASARLVFTGTEFFFDGHFPGEPVLPAVAQVDAAIALASRILGAPHRLAEVTRAKFTAPTGPGRDLSLRVDLDRAEPDRVRLRAQLHAGPTQVSEFTARITPD